MPRNGTGSAEVSQKDRNHFEYLTQGVSRRKGVPPAMEKQRVTHAPWMSSVSYVLEEMEATRWRKTKRHMEGDRPEHLSEFYGLSNKF